jgi:PEP-CTERM motif
MRDGSRWLGWLVIAVLLLWTPQAALAEIITPVQTRSAPLADTDWSLKTPLDQNGNPTPFDKFVPSNDSALKSVVINVEWRADSTFNMKFTTASTITVTATGSLTILGPDGLPLPMTVPDPLFTNSQSVTELSIASVPFATKTFTGSTQIVLSDPASLALFTSQGANDLTFTIPMMAAAQSSFMTTSGNGFGQAFTKMSATISIQYNEDVRVQNEEVPEPGTLILLGSGGATCLLVCLIRRRFTRR